jgi:hypothetical protein
MTSDLIFVLAGLEDRKRYGLELFQQRIAPRILLSVSRFEIRRFANLELPVPLDLLERASKVPPPQRHFFVLFEGQVVQVNYIKPRRFGTLTEVESLMRWLKERPEIHSMAIVSSNSHLRRIRMCCKSLLSDSFEVRLIAVPQKSIRKLDSDFAKGFLVETCKTVLYWFILKFWRYSKCVRISLDISL